MGVIMVYGANGYSGQLAALHAQDRGIQAIIAGRSANSIDAVAQKTGFPTRIFALDDHATIVRNLSGVSVVLNCAGPFSRTAIPLVNACREAGVHYVDITGEIEIIEALQQRDEEFKAAGITVIPACGFDVVPTDCTARRLAERMPDAVSLELAFMSSGGLSHGTATTMISKLGSAGQVRKDGAITEEAIAHRVQEVDFDGATSACISIPWGDVASAWYTTKIPNIVTYIAVPARTATLLNRTAPLSRFLAGKPVRAIAQRYVDARISGPSEQARARGRSHVWGRVTNANGESLESVLHTCEAYHLTALTSVDIAARIQAGQVAPGAYTPAGALGADYITNFEGSSFVDR